MISSKFLSLPARAAPLGRAAVASTARAFTSSSVSLGGASHHGDGPYEPVFHRIPLPDKPIPENSELIWDDGVAPETAVDFDAPHISRGAGLLAWLGGLAFFASVFLFAKSTNHPSNKKSGDRLFPEEDLSKSLGGYGYK